MRKARIVISSTARSTSEWLLLDMCIIFTRPKQPKHFLSKIGKFNHISNFQ